MVEAHITVSRFVEGGYAETVGQVLVPMGRPIADGAFEFKYRGNMNNALAHEIMFSGVLGQVGDGLGRGNFSLAVSGKEYLNVGGFFTHVPLAVAVYVDVIECWVSVHASLGANA